MTCHSYFESTGGFSKTVATIFQGSVEQSILHQLQVWKRNFKTATFLFILMTSTPVTGSAWRSCCYQPILIHIQLTFFVKLSNSQPAEESPALKGLVLGTPPPHNPFSVASWVVSEKKFDRHGFISLPNAEVCLWCWDVSQKTVHSRL